uniref:Uncharacterized protein n=1 Tax=Anguilla anguilla TaxID=7936 RepID=A0A0E9QAY1_ANGAN
MVFWAVFFFSVNFNRCLACLLLLNHTPNVNKKICIYSY